MISSANLFMKFTKTFQKDEPLVHILYSELSTLIQTLISRVCKQSNLDKKYTDVDSLLQEENYLPLKQINCSEPVLEALDHVSENDKMYFLKDIQKHYISACKVLLKNIAMSSDLLKKLRFLHPVQRKSVRSCRDIVAVAKYLQIDVPHDILLDEWKLLQLEKECEQNSERIDCYWSNLLSIKNDGQLKYATVAKVIKAALVLSHGNSDVERCFSFSGRVLTDNRAAMSERTLNSIMTVKSILKFYNNQPEQVPITKELLIFTRNASKSCENYLYEQKYQTAGRTEEKRGRK